MMNELFEDEEREIFLDGQLYHECRSVSTETDTAPEIQTVLRCNDSLLDTTKGANNDLINLMSSPIGTDKTTSNVHKDARTNLKCLKRKRQQEQCFNKKLLFSNIQLESPPKKIRSSNSLLDGKVIVLSESESDVELLIDDEVAIVETPAEIITIDDDSNALDECQRASVDSFNLNQQHLATFVERDMLELASMSRRTDIKMSDASTHSESANSAEADFTFTVSGAVGSLDAQNFAACLLGDQQLPEDPSKAGATVTPGGGQEEIDEDVMIIENPPPIIEILDDDPTTIKKPDSRRSFSDYWTEDMHKFYRESWGHENFNLNEELASMSNDPDKWRICREDEYPTRRDGDQCKHCGQTDHMAYHCTNKAEICHFCAKQGHSSSQCPLRICTMCGVPSQWMSKFCHRCQWSQSSPIPCKVCGLMGHDEKICTDRWRRFFFTTEPLAADAEPNEPPGPPKPPKAMWCPWCGKSGHYDFTCKKCPASYRDLRGKQEKSDNLKMSMSDEGMEYHLSPTRYYSLFSLEGRELCRQIKKDYNATIELLGGKQKTYRYRITGVPFQSSRSIQRQINRFLDLQCNSVNSDSIVVHMAYFSATGVHWRSLGHSLLQQIKRNKYRSLRYKKTRSLYCMLNALVLCKAGSLDDRKHFDLLQNFASFSKQQRKENLNNDIRRSFAHLFSQSDQLSNDYASWINQIPVEDKCRPSLSFKNFKKIFRAVNN